MSKVKRGNKGGALIPQNVCPHHIRDTRDRSLHEHMEERPCNSMAWYGREAPHWKLGSGPRFTHELWFSGGSPNNFGGCLFTHGLKSYRNTDVQQIQTTGIWSSLETDWPVGISQFLFSSKQLFASKCSVHSVLFTNLSFRIDHCGSHREEFL